MEDSAGALPRIPDGQDRRDFDRSAAPNGSIEVTPSEATSSTEAQAPDGQFSEAVRLWLSQNCPPSMRTSMPEGEEPWGGRHPSFPNPETRLWLDRMASRGWTAPHWAPAYGGAGLAPWQIRILEAELTAIGARPPLRSFGLWMLAPVLLEYGTEDQKRRFLPDIARGAIRWCQGYSEPGAGSDLAALRTRAERDGDDFIVNGGKVWTTHADRSDWMFCLVRTDREASKHRGISFLLIDLDTAGVERRPIQLISGASDFCETFFTDVRVPAANLVGAPGQGWEIAKRLLQYERQNVAGSGFGTDGQPTIETLLHSPLHRKLDPVQRDRLAGHRMETEALELFVAKTGRRVAAEGADPLVSIVKVAAAKLNQARSELLIEIAGLDMLGWGDSAPSSALLPETAGWLRSRANSIEGGTSEINLNILAKAVLGLPNA